MLYNEENIITPKLKLKDAARKALLSCILKFFLLGMYLINRSMHIMQLPITHAIPLIIAIIQPLISLSNESASILTVCDANFMVIYSCLLKGSLSFSLFVSVCGVDIQVITPKCVQYKVAQGRTRSKVTVWDVAGYPRCCCRGW